MSESPRSNNSKVNATDADVNSTKTTGVALDLKANSVTTGQALKVSATSVTGAGSAVEITGQAGQTALNVAAGNVSITGELQAPVLKAPVENGDANLTVTEALHAGTIVMQTDVSGDKTYTIPAPSAAGVTYRFVGQGTGTAADSHDIILSTAATGTVFFDGMITHHDTDIDTSGGALNVGVWGDGSTHDLLTLNVPAGYDITLIAKSTTVFYITGSVTSAAAPAFTAP